MKKIIFIVLLGVLSSCQRDDGSVREIDQITRIYIDSAGIDLLNTELEYAYKTKRFNDVLGEADYTPVSFSALQDETGRYYLAYTAGATREIVEETAQGSRVRSVISFEFAQSLGVSTTPLPVTDTLVIDYLYNEQIFTIQRANYNGADVYSGKVNNYHTIEIHK